MITSKIVADSIDKRGNRITTAIITLPRIILSELNTHRMLSKNSASSRAIPFNKMIESVQTNPFIPIAFQENHSGMQGTEYLNGIEEENAIDNWLLAKDSAIKEAEILYSNNITKQLCNRLLEPFMYHTVLITGTDDGWNNFFNLRCPSYIDTVYGKEHASGTWKSKKDYCKHFNIDINSETNIQWLRLNKGQAEIHMMMLSEKIYDCIQESVPTQLKGNEWHLPMIEVIED